MYDKFSMYLVAHWKYRTTGKQPLQNIFDWTSSEFMILVQIW